MKIDIYFLVSCYIFLLVIPTNFSNKLKSQKYMMNEDLLNDYDDFYNNINKYKSKYANINFR
jgi:hypothetical protein